MKLFTSVKSVTILLFLVVMAGLCGTLYLLTTRGLLFAPVSAASGPSTRDAAAAARALLDERQANLTAKAMALAESQVMVSSLMAKKPNVAQIQDVYRQLTKSAGVSLLIVTHRNGDLLYDPKAGGIPAAPALASVSNDVLQGASLRPCVADNGRFLQTAAAPARIPDKVLGAVVVAFPIDAAFSAVLKSMTGAEVALLQPDKCLNTTSSSLPPPLLDRQILPLLPKAGEKQADGIVPVALQGANWEVSFLPLPGVRDEASGHLAFLKRATSAPAPVPLRWPLYAAIGFWTAVGLFFALLVGRVALKPLKRIEQVIERAELGDLKGFVEVPGSHEAAPLAHTVNRFIGNWQERELFKNILGKYAPQSTVKTLLASGEPPVLQGERRQVVLLSCGIRGFSAFTENEDPAKLSKGLNDFFTLMSNIVYKYDGMVDKFVGDTLMALWGAPLPQDDAEMRAVRTALEMQEALKDFNTDRVKQNLHPMMVGIGIVAGELVTGNLGSEQNPDYTIIGNEVDLVRKLAAKASAGQIVVADPAFQKVKDRVEVNPLAPIVQKGVASRGFSEPVRIHVVTDLKS